MDTQIDPADLDTLEFFNRFIVDSPQGFEYVGLIHQIVRKYRNVTFYIMRNDGVYLESTLAQKLQCSPQVIRTLATTSSRRRDDMLWNFTNEDVNVKWFNGPAYENIRTYLWLTKKYPCESTKVETAPASNVPADLPPPEVVKITSDSGADVVQITKNWYFYEYLAHRLSTLPREWSDKELREKVNKCFSNLNKDVLCRIEEHVDRIGVFATAALIELLVQKQIFDRDHMMEEYNMLTSEVNAFEEYVFKAYGRYGN